MDEYESKEKLNAEGVALVEELYDDYHDKVLRYIKSVLGRNNQMLAEDILHETFYEALRKSGDLVHHPNPIGWLMEVTKFKLYAYYRRASINDIGLDDCEEEMARLEDQYGIQELNLLMESVFNNHERRLFEMYFIEGYSAKEMAKLEKITESNFKVRMHRLRKKLLDKVGFICIALLFICLQWGGSGLL